MMKSCFFLSIASSTILKGLEFSETLSLVKSQYFAKMNFYTVKEAYSEQIYLVAWNSLEPASTVFQLWFNLKIILNKNNMMLSVSVNAISCLSFGSCLKISMSITLFNIRIAVSDILCFLETWIWKIFVFCYFELFFNVILILCILILSMNFKNHLFNLKKL